MGRQSDLEEIKSRVKFKWLVGGWVLRVTKVLLLVLVICTVEEGALLSVDLVMQFAFPSVSP